MKTVISIMATILFAGCASYEVSTVDELARTNWQVSLDRRFLALQQEAIVIPVEFKIREDPIEAEISQHGYIAGYNWARSGAVMHGTRDNTPPLAIVGDRHLSDIWRQAESAGLSNGVARVDAYFKQEKK
jgi:hypothetical protein